MRKIFWVLQTVGQNGHRLTDNCRQLYWQ